MVEKCLTFVFKSVFLNIIPLAIVLWSFGRKHAGSELPSFKSNAKREAPTVTVNNI